MKKCLLRGAASSFLMAAAALSAYAQTEAEVTKTPPGTPKAYARTEYVTDYQLDMRWQSGLAQDIYFNGNEVWIPNLVSKAGDGSYTKGTITEGDATNGTITFPNPVYVTTGGTQAWLMKYDDSGFSLVKDESRNDFKLYIKDGVITAEKTNVPEGLTLQATVMGWFGDTSCASVLERFEPAPSAQAVEVPASLEWKDYETYNKNASELDKNTRGYLSQVARDGNDFYFKGFLPKHADLVMKGTLGTDGKIRFANGAYLGLYQGCYTFLKTADVSVEPGRLGSYYYEYTAKDTPSELVMTFNPQTGEITSQDVFVPVQGYKGFLNFETSAGHLYQPTFIPFVKSDPVVIPESATPEQWAVSSVDLTVADKDLRKSAKVAVYKDGNDIYFQGFGYYPDLAFKGTVSADGSSVSVKVPQYMGDYYGTPIYLYTCATETTPDEAYAGFNTVKYTSNTANRTVTLTRDAQGRYSTTVNLAVAQQFADPTPTAALLKPTFYALDLSKAVEVPADAVAKSYALVSLTKPGSDIKTSTRVTVSSKGNDYYFTGASAADPSLTFHGTLQADGKTIKVEAPQYLATLPAEYSWDGDRLMFLTGAFAKMRESAGYSDTYYATNDPEDGFLTFTIEGDEIIPAGDFTIYALGTELKSAILSGRFEQITSEMPVVPADAAVSDYLATCSNVNEYQSIDPFAVKVASKGDDLWLSFALPGTADMVVRAKRAADGIVIEPEQFVGDANLVNLAVSEDASLVLGTVDEMTYTPVDTPYKLATDAKSRLIAARTDALVFYRAGGQPIVAIRNLDLEPMLKEARTPAPAIINSYKDQSSFWGKDIQLNFDIPTEDKDGNAIDGKELSYRIYLDGTLYEFTPENYPYDEFEEATSEIPFNFEGNSFDVSNTNHRVSLQDAATQTVGVQVGHTFNGTTIWNDRVDFDIVKGSMVGQDGDFTFSFATTEPTQGWGTEKGESYDVAILLDDYDLFTNRQITGVRIPVVENPGINDYKVWITSDLSTIDGPTVAAQPHDGYLEVTFDEPYNISWNAYVGYSFIVDDVNDATRKPVLTSPGAEYNGLYVKTSSTMRTWTAIPETTALVSGIEVMLKGDYPAEAAGIGLFPTIKVQTGKPATATLNVANRGRLGVNSARYYWECNGFRGYGDLTDLNIPATYNRQAPFTLELPQIDEPGEYPLVTYVTRVNGHANKALYSGADGVVKAMTMLPVHRVLVEEWTGLWCGWCPRGLYALEWLAENRPDTFVGVSYHGNDQLMMAEGMFVPQQQMGFPAAMFEREKVVDPFDSEGVNRFSAPNTFDRHAEPEVPVALEVAAEWTDNTHVAATATLTAVEALDPKATYAVEFVLLGDGIHSPDFKQINDFSGNPTQPEEMAWWKEQGKEVTDYVYNDVALMSTGGYGLDGSLPKAIPTDEVLTATHTFDLAKALNIANQPLLMDLTKLKVAAFMVKRNDSFGEIVNAAVSTHLPDPAGIDCIGIDSESSNAEVVASSFYTLDGRAISAPVAGSLVLRVDRLTDGTTRTTKLIVR